MRAGVDQIGTGGGVVIAALKAAPNSGLRRASELASAGRGLPARWPLCTNGDY
jgi:hypothetical protein